jgi:hypothetical protein
MWYSPFVGFGRIIWNFGTGIGTAGKLALFSSCGLWFPNSSKEASPYQYQYQGADERRSRNFCTEIVSSRGGSTALKSPVSSSNRTCGAAKIIYIINQISKKIF